eukprot:6338834-Amphidinium_carterae.1
MPYNSLAALAHSCILLYSLRTWVYGGMVKAKVFTVGLLQIGQPQFGLKTTSNLILLGNRSFGCSCSADAKNWP